MKASPFAVHEIIDASSFCSILYNFWGNPNLFSFFFEIDVAAEVLLSSGELSDKSADDAAASKLSNAPFMFEVVDMIYLCIIAYYLQEVHRTKLEKNIIYVRYCKWL